MDASEFPARQYLILNNVQKRQNIRHLLSSANVFCVEEVLVVGVKSFDLEAAQESSPSIKFLRFASLGDCRKYLTDKEVTICGLEIMHNALDINTHPFSGSTAFILGNEGSGLSKSQIEICDFFVYIPQHGGGTASLNVTVAASIVMHHFALFAKYPRKSIHGNKFS